LPVWVDTEIVHTLIQDCEVSGTIGVSTVKKLNITGYISAPSLERLAEPLGQFSGLLLNSIELDVDTDDDGEPDSVSFEMLVTASEVTLNMWNDAAR